MLISKVITYRDGRTTPVYGAKRWNQGLITYKCDSCGKEIKSRYITYCKKHKTVKGQIDICSPCKIKADKDKVENKTIDRLFDKYSKALDENGFILMTKREDIRRTETLDVICLNHKDKGIQKISKRTITGGIAKGHFGCRHCRRDIVWKGGITPLIIHLRNSLPSWTQEQFKRSNYKCEITGKTGILNVHHMYSFSNILRDTLEELNMDIRPNIGDYSEDELQLITDVFMFNNDKLAKPIVMLEEIHKEFHKFCGGYHKDTSMEQLEEFKATLIA